MIGVRPASFVLSLLALVGCSDRSEPRPAPRPNIVLVTLDTARADRFGAYACSDCETPAFDSLAAVGTLYTRAWTVAPLTAPAHASMLTGSMPATHGVRINGRRRIRDELPTLAQLLFEAGYETGAFVAAFPVTRLFGFDTGFVTFDDAMGSLPSGKRRMERLANEVNSKALPWLEERLKGSEERPLFAWVHYYDAHASYAPPEPFATRFRGREYDGEIAWMDQNLGEILEVVRSSPAADRTVIIVVGDHGEGLRDHEEDEHGILLYDEVLHVPFVIAGGGRFPSGERRDEVVSVVDVFATCLGLAGVPRPDGTTGQDLTIAPDQQSPGPGVLDRSGTERVVLAEASYAYRSFGWAPLFAVRVEDEKWIAAPEPEYYNLASDSGETENLVGSDPTRELELAALLELVLAEMEQAGASQAVIGDVQAMEQLKALGYVAAGAFEDDPNDDARIGRNPREGIADYEAYEAAKGALTGGLEACQRSSEALSELVSRDPMNPAFRGELAAAQLCAGDTASGEVTLRALVHDFPEYHIGRTKLARYFTSQGRHDEAVASWEEVQSRSEARNDIANAVAAGQGLASAQLAANRPEDALETVEATRARWGWTVDLALLAGRALERLGRPTEALERYGQALKLDPANLAALRSSMEILKARGARAEWESLLRSCLARAPEHPTLVELARMYGISAP